MTEIVSILLIGISLSMDTFSLSLSLGSIFRENRLLKYFPLLVGIFHFIMPLLGNVIGLKLVSLFDITSNVILGLVLIILGMNLAIHFFKDEKISLNLNMIGAILLSFSVSIDSFSVGLGINDLSNNYYFSSLIFALCSFSFTCLGLLIGKYSKKIIGKPAIILGIIILLALGIYHLFN